MSLRAFSVPMSEEEVLKLLGLDVEGFVVPEIVAPRLEDDRELYISFMEIVEELLQHCATVYNRDGLELDESDLYDIKNEEGLWVLLFAPEGNSRIDLIVHVGNRLLRVGILCIRLDDDRPLYRLEMYRSA